ncbi:MAG: hypothetical protein P4L51_12550 [Puia sp.]|nr:hypothetical protein [Puia sp.]
MKSPRLFHISEEPGIPSFKPRPSPSFFSAIQGDTVFAITEKLLHNYLLPRDCPRVTFYANAKTTAADVHTFMGHSSAAFVVAVEAGWYPLIARTRLYCYEFPTGSFSVLDEIAGYYISYEEVAPVSVREIADIPAELFKRNIELRIMPTLWILSDAIARSSLSYSIIRMRNAIPRQTEPGQTKTG